MITKFFKKFEPLIFLVKRYKSMLFVIFLLSVVAGLLGNINLALFHMFLQRFFSGGSPESSQMGRYFNILLNAIPLNDKVVLSGLLICCTLLMKNITMITDNSMMAKVSSNTLYDLKKMLMEKYGRARYQFFLDTKYGKISYSVLTAPLRAAQMMLSLPRAGAEVVKISMIIAFLFYYNWQATLICSLALMVYVGFVRFLSRRISYVTGKGRVEASKDNTNEFNEFVTGIKYINIFGRKDRWLNMFDRSNSTFSQLYRKDTFWTGVPKEFLEFFFFGGAVIGLLMVHFTLNGSVVNIIPSIGVYFMAMMNILPSANIIGRELMYVGSLMADAEMIYNTIREDIDALEDKGQSLEKFHSAIRFEEVSLCYKGRDIILDKAEMVMERGKVTAIVGESGSGKSSILNLILRLYEPTGGQITIDGQPLNSIQLKSWLDRVGFVGQDTFIFHSTVCENITFGNDKYSREEVIRAAEIAGIHDFIMSLPQGYDTVVGERGMKLSGGQQQRIAIARAIIRNPEVLILDEATSSLDSTTEKHVQEAIDKAFQQRTVVIVAHRLSTVKNADKICVLKQGRVIEEGSHEQLLTKRGEYWRLYTSQEQKIAANR